MTDPLSVPGMRSGSESIRRALIPTAYGHIHVRLAGDSGNNVPLVLLHMTPMSSAMYDPLLPLFGRDRRVVAPDRPGFGYSDVPEHSLTMAEYAQTTLEVLDHLGVEEFDVLGTHTGSVE